MQKGWAKKHAGFTIVELLIVIVVIAILAAITIVAFTGIQQRATNTRFLSAIDTYEKALRMYYTENNAFPESSGSNACLGGGYNAVSGFDQDSCFTGSSGVNVVVSPAINQAIQKYISPLPSVADVVFSLAGQPYTRGVWYAGGDNGGTGQYASIAYYINGDQMCGRGTKQTIVVSGTQLTACTVIIINPKS